MHIHTISESYVIKVSCLLIWQDTRMEQLTELLNNYTTYGVPSSQIYPQGQVESLDALYKLEGDWREIINYKGKLKVINLECVLP